MMLLAVVNKKFNPSLKVASIIGEIWEFYFFMFSYFEKGIIDTHPKKTIDQRDLVNLIINNPCRVQIETIREFKRQGNLSYKVLKRKLPNITPNCIVKKRSLDDADFETNFVQNSRYIYFDIDEVPNVDEFKKSFIVKYGHLVSVVCKSTSGMGISILFRLTNTIVNKHQFFQIWNEIRTTILKDEKIDPDCKDIGRAMYISYDPEVYYNYDNEITVKVSDIITVKPDN